jgi:hypothetical protein
MPFLRARIFHPLEEQPGWPLCSEGGKRIDAGTLGDAMQIAGQIYGIRIVPHDPPKWFRAYGVPGWDEHFMLVDVHVLRGSEEICPKQDVLFRLLEADIVKIGVIAC